MDDQTKMIDMNTGRERMADTSRQGGVGDVLHDITTLMELQAKLLAADAKQATRLTIVSGVAIAIGLCLFLGAIPLILFVIADSLSSMTTLNLVTSLSVTGGATVVLAGIVVIAGTVGIRRGLGNFNRSRKELSQNFQSIKHSFKRNR